MVRRIGRYEITGKLGDGGFSSVYQGFDPTVERVVAIKVLSTQGDASLVSRFRSEAMTAGNLHHRNIVTIYEFGEDGGTPFLAMEYLDGLDLQQIVNNKSNLAALTLLEKVEIMAEVAQGLQCAHDSGVVHRDVKPGNIMRLKNGSVKIMDFGIARLMSSATTRLTRTGLMIGTVDYMAPEQFKTSEVDALCDIWSYGVVFYELLTGINPFRAEDPAGAMYRITMEEPEPVTSLVPDCPPALASNLQRLLSKDRHNRIQSLDDFLLDTEPIIRDLARIEVPALLRKVERLTDSDDLDQSQAIMRRILRLERSNPEVRQMRERLRERFRVRAFRPRIDALLHAAEEEASSGNFALAIEKLNSAIQLDPDSPTIRGRIEQVRGQEERAKRAEELIDQGRRSLEAGDLTSAFRQFSQVLETEPGNVQVSALVDKVRSAIHEREVRAHVTAVMDEANNLIVIQEYDEAIALLAQLADSNSEEQVVNRLIEARQLKAQEAKDRLNAGIHAAKDLLRNGSCEQAFDALKELDHQYPGNPAVGVLLTHAQERLRAENLAHEINTLLANARAARANGNFGQALQYIESALDLDGTNSNALSLQRIYLDEQRIDQDQRKIEAELERYRAFLTQENLEAAVALINRLEVDYPAHTLIADARREAEERVQRRDELRRREIERGLRDAELLLTQGRAESAARLLGNLTIDFPAEAAVRDLLEHARQLKQSQDRLNTGLRSAKELLKNESFEEACSTLEELDNQYPKNPAVEVLLTHARERLRAAEANAEIHKLLGDARSYQTLGQFEPALQAVQSALNLDPSNDAALALQRTLLDEQQRDQDRRRIEENLRRCQLLVNEGKLDEALVVAEELAAAYPREARVAETRSEIDERIRKDAEREIQKAIREARSLLADGRVESATQLLENLSRQFPGESSVQDLLDYAQQLRLSQEASDRLNSGLNAAKALLENADFGQACRALEQLDREYPNSPAVEVLLTHARHLEQEHLQRKEIQETLEAAGEFASRQEWEKALHVIDQAMTSRPGCPEYAEEAKKFQRLKEQHEELSAIEAAMAAGHLEQAMSMAEATLLRFPGEPRAVAALQSARNLRELNDLVLYARRRVTKGDLDEAAQLLTEGRLRFPDSPALREIDAEIQIAREFELAAGRARKALKQRNFNEARNIAESLLTAFAGNPAIQGLLEEINTRQREYERRQAYDRERVEAERLARSFEFQAAVEKIQQLLGDHPGDPALNDDLSRVIGARDDHTRREVYVRARAEAQSLSDRGKFDEAIAVIQNLIHDFPGDPILHADLEAMQAAKLLREDRVSADAQLNELDVLFRKGEVEAVRQGAKEILSLHNEPRAAELLDWAEMSIAQTRELRRNKRRSPLTLWGAVGGVVVVVVIAVLVGSPQPAAAPSTLTVRPAEVGFYYVRGDTIPKPQSFQIKAPSPSQSWTISSRDPWLRISKANGMGTSFVDISIDPAKLAAGEYVSTAAVSSASGQKDLIVSLSVIEPPQTARLPSLLPAELRIAPADLVFAYEKGGPLPATQWFRIVTIPAGQNWTVVGEENWVLLSKHASEGSSEIEVRVDPSRLATGDYTDTVRITSAAAVKPLNVHLHVTEHAPVFDPVVNCHDDQFNGRYKGTIAWSGPLNDGEAFTITNKNVASTGIANGRELPGCPVSIAPVAGLEIQEPSLASNYRQIRVTNKSGHPIDSVKITWNVKK